MQPSPGCGYHRRKHTTETVFTKEAAALLGLRAAVSAQWSTPANSPGTPHHDNMRIWRERVEATLHPVSTYAEAAAVELLIFEQVLGCPVNETRHDARTRTRWPIGYPVFWRLATDRDAGSPAHSSR